MDRAEYCVDQRSAREDPIVRMFLSACHDLDITPREIRSEEERGKVFFGTNLMSGQEASTVLELLREEGFNVELTTGVLQYKKYAVVLCQ